MAKLTRARRRGLEVLAEAHPQTCRRSNGASGLGEDQAVYWQTADWLVEQGYATPADGEPDEFFTNFGLTDSGLALCATEGLDLGTGDPRRHGAAAGATEPPPSSTFAYLPIGRLVPSPGNLRRDLGDLEPLAASIKAGGVRQALLVTLDFPHPDQWVILAGHRRHAAATLAGLETVPCVIAEAVPDGDRLTICLVENLQRADLAPLEEAEGYSQLVKLGMSQRAIAAAVGYTQSHVSKRLSLLDLPVEAKKRIDDGSMTLEQAAKLLKLKADPQALEKAAKAANVDHAVDAALQERAYHEAVDEMVAAAKSKGWAVVAPSGAKGYASVGNWSDLDFGTDKKNKAHESEPCHAVLLPNPGWMWQTPNHLRPVCTDRKRHAKDGASKLKVPKSERSATEEKRLDDERQRRQATAARTAALQGVLSGPFDQAEATKLILARFIDVSWASTRKLADRLLDFEIPGRGEVVGRADVLRLAYAVVLAGLEERARGAYGYGPPAELLAVLAAVGYEPSEWERAQAEDLAKVEAEEAAFELELEEGRNVDEDPPGPPPQEALAWYRGFSEDDPARWLADDSDTEAILEMFPDRVELLPQPVDDAGIRTCRECGCTDERACPDGCSWVEDDLCSACEVETVVDEPAAAL